MPEEDEFLGKIIDIYKKKKIRKTNDCPKEETIWDLRLGLFDQEKRNHLHTHIDTCPYCLQLFSEIGIYLNPPEIDIPEEVSRKVHEAIQSTFTRKSLVQIAFKAVKETTKLLIDKVIELTEKGKTEIPIETVPSFAMGGEEKESEQNDYTFNTDELEVSVYPKADDLTITIDEGENYSGKKEIDDYECILVVEGREPRREKPQDGIVKFLGVKDEDFKVLIE